MTPLEFIARNSTADKPGNHDMLQPRSPALICFVCTAILSTSAWADDFNVRVSLISTGKKLQTKQTRISKPPGKKLHLNLNKPDEETKPLPRLIFKARPDQKIRVQWQALNPGKLATLENLLIHFFVVKIDQPNQQQVPKLNKNVVHEGLLSMDFKPTEKATGEFTLQLEKPGYYLVRVETIGAIGLHGHEHFAAVDLHVEQETSN